MTIAVSSHRRLTEKGAHDRVAPRPTYMTGRRAAEQVNPLPPELDPQRARKLERTLLLRVRETVFEGGEESVDVAAERVDPAFRQKEQARLHRVARRAARLEVQRRRLGERERRSRRRRHGEPRASAGNAHVLARRHGRVQCDGSSVELPTRRWKEGDLPELSSAKWGEPPTKVASFRSKRNWERG